MKKIRAVANKDDDVVSNLPVQAALKRGVLFILLKIQGCAALGIESQKADTAAVVITMDDRNWDDAEGV